MISAEEIEKIARLAHLSLDEQEKQRFAEEVGRILDYVNKLNEIDTNHVAPLSHTLEINNVFREDKVKPSLPREEALRNAPRKDDSFFHVPKVVKK
ncbi:MAG TPA: Asp-tRNA(Asn)/Glu-tRNA(Gln) amidotransferase subunit GatC [Caldithrix abyssi]|uniref:Aspartyl/glutamyl-tRNA(Asn/Gln) amidotransferase subunit C n=1 Tax=Caldithrix abyssi TaxID=187145 RepID=A0A7V4TX20_CALAY|nr:Asp-tRNA(Asn)/Glu-tRNA(Gln) amidotransferase subunit GatC [Caldithrix abyssi]